jgi:hypothetical protein
LILTLPEVARAVADALGLEPAGDYYRGERPLYTNGSNLTDPYWRCACEDWLHERGWEHYGQDAHSLLLLGGEAITVYGSRAEAPARLVAAVWEKMREGK